VFAWFVANMCFAYFGMCILSGALDILSDHVLKGGWLSGNLPCVNCAIMSAQVDVRLNTFFFLMK